MVEISIAYALLQLGRDPEAEDAIAPAIDRSSKNLRRDPQNVDVMLDHLSLLNMGVETAFKTGKMPLAARRAREAWQLDASAPPGVTARLSESAANRAYTDYLGGLAQLTMGPAPEACKHLRAVLAYLQHLKPEEPDAVAAPRKFVELVPALKRCPTVVSATK
jgi:hypothetical protein